MAHSLLNRLLLKKRGGLILNTLPNSVCIIDEYEVILYGIQPESNIFRHPIQVQNHIYGWVIAESSGEFLANIFSQLLEAEFETISLTDEILDLYREINLIYALSDKLANTLDVKTIIQTVMDEAMRLIGSEHGIVLLYNDLRNKFESIVHGETDPQLTTSDYALLDSVIQNGSADIINNTAALSMAIGIETNIQSLVFAALSNPQDILGAMIVFSKKETNFKARDLRFLITLAAQTTAAIENVRLHQQVVKQEVIRSNLLRQFPPKMAEHLLNSSFPFQLGGDQVSPITLLISDVRGFTALSMTMQPNEVVQKLNEMFSRLVPIIFKYDGIVDKFVGDAILTIFGSPEPDNNQWEKAVNCAIEMQSAIGEFDRLWQIGIGIHSGEAVHGFIGSSERMEYTVIGDAVNRTSRYCDGAQHGEILISKEVHNHVANHFLFDKNPRIVKTKHPEREPHLEGYLVLGVSS